MPVNDRTARAPALGYLYQARYALLLLLQAQADSARISLERFDDVAFEQDGIPLELIQTKHHMKQSVSLSDSSADLWKTLGNWIHWLSRPSIDEGTMFTLTTTATAVDDGAASKLRPGNNRDTANAARLLVQIAETSKNATNAIHYAAFLDLNQQAQEAFLDRVFIIDNSPTIIDAKGLILRELRLVTRPAHKEAIYARLEGWWFAKVVDHLSADSMPFIEIAEVQAVINDLQEGFQKDNLPIDFPAQIAIEEANLGPAQRRFVEQLRIVMVGNTRIDKAISDYYRAYQQRSRWVREELLLDEELASYEQRLIDEWERHFQIMCEDLGQQPPEDRMQTAGRHLFNRIDGQSIPIRPKCTDPFVMRGSYHILANALRVGWHPDFVNRLQRLIKGIDYAALGN